MIHFHYQLAGAIQYSQRPADRRISATAARMLAARPRLNQQVIEDAGQIRHRDPTSLMDAHPPAAHAA
jgi:hypothetical protein